MFTLSNKAVVVEHATCLRIIAHTHAIHTLVQSERTPEVVHTTRRATAVVPWLPQLRELESLRHGVIQEMIRRKQQQADHKKR